MLRSFRNIIQRFSRSESEHQEYQVPYKALIGIFGVILVSYPAYNLICDPLSYRQERERLLKSALAEQKVFTGIRREEESKRITEKLKSGSVVILYGLPLSGKTAILDDIQSRDFSAQTLRINIKDSLNDTINQFPWDHKLGSI